MAGSGEDTFGNYVWRDGRLVPWAEATVHATLVGHASVSSVFEGIKAYWNPEQKQLHVFRLKEHLERFFRSIKLVRLSQPYSIEELSRAVVETLRANECREDTYIRPWIITKTSIKKVMAPVNAPVEVLITTWPFQTRLLSGDGCKVCVSSWKRVNEAVAPPRIKAFANYHNGRMAEMEARLNGYDWALLLNEHGKVTEGPAACFGMVRDNTLITPDLGSGVLEGITRDTFLRMAPELADVKVQERAVDRSELYTADEMFFMGTGRELWPIIEVDRFPVGEGKIGRVTQMLDRGYNSLVRGGGDKGAEWRTPVW
ncbi:MAG: branched-chain amino acid transaminase [Myxococcaceae bacterium]|nr:branched-chain amino acid transaminase [Myxococcaceae bacterium]